MSTETFFLKARGSIVGRHFSIQEDEIDQTMFKEDTNSKPLISVLLDMLDVKVSFMCILHTYIGSYLSVAITPRYGVL